MSASTQHSDTQRPVNEGFTEGGDLTLRSTDNVDFSVHSLFLSVASPAFSRWITVDGAGRNLVNLPYKSETVALMLKFIYPLPPPVISSFEQLDDALSIAEKFRLEAMRLHLRERMALPNSPVSISANPLRAWSVANAHGLPEETDAALSLASKRYDFPQACMSHLAENMPGWISLLKLTTAPLVKLHILTDVLFSFRKEPMQLNSNNCQWTLCEFCAGMFFNSKLYSAPEWQARWAHAVFMQLKCLPIHEWGPVFKIEFFNAALHRNGEVPIRFPGSHGTCTCPDSISQFPVEFEQWTASVHEHLKERVTPVLLGERIGGLSVGQSHFMVRDIEFSFRIMHAAYSCNRT